MPYAPQYLSKMVGIWRKETLTPNHYRSVSDPPKIKQPNQCPNIQPSLIWINSFNMWFVCQLSFTSQVLSHGLRSTALCLAGLQSIQYREQGPARRPLPAFVLKLWFGPRCLRAHSSLMSEVRHCCHPGNWETWRWTGSGRQRDFGVCVWVGGGWQPWLVHCCNTVTSIKWSLQSIVRLSCRCFLSSQPTTRPYTPRLHRLTRV